ncbi:Homeodomain-like DNA binding domain-containing transcription factor [Phycomyces blakesleeanus NRRL 1555(-)]|uniref:Homeodomain-like DNA binding domain-containing transcription factor n=1 Tax=Phycomyces blakesleeanus (strain ATCC 8743b / DSM 1359 / FGSC 10004 / NBRC 33097 / NRRL 1555) TaxID=763407 RepID=A0A162NCM1_PHYB8|nr:Homeodomain-like DNA binding domain-containing transcription factor [Phycomyces blakesleeanus NRRL 1555(-)]OAD68134.1 Homeodomain-like DNA binding domain-containing transcription factor [Phycomyces blakesleeanus NRRL 1555(-)]|eukprot:XP_018286174.1 Homeodomain-like DNA binding domain-containing transcription factor [Phycomyces blakesleeanus NRRL 1555(-)]
MDIKNLLCPTLDSDDHFIYKNYSPVYSKASLNIHIETQYRQPSVVWSSTSSTPSSPQSMNSSLASVSYPAYSPVSSPPTSPLPSPSLYPLSQPITLAPNTSATVPAAAVVVGRQCNSIETNSRQHTRTPWTPEEDFLLQQGFMQDLSWAMISATYLPHRSRGCCWGRFKTLQTKEIEQREWSNEDDKQLMLVIKNHARLFKQAWKSVAQNMKNRTWRECEFRSIKYTSLIRKRRSRGI